MNQIYQFESERLGFRFWNTGDQLPFFKMNADSKVMEFFPKTLSREESDAFIEKIKAHFERYGYGLWAVELKSTREFMGFIGFHTATFEAEFTPCVEIGWRLDQRFWNKGYATEGAKKCLEVGFEQLKLDNVYSFTAKLNRPSIKVMEKIGLKYQGSFFHPNIDIDHPLRCHVLYRIDRETY